MPDKIIPPDAVGTLFAAAWAMVWAFVGRLLYVLNLVRLGKRDGFFSAQTVWELGVAIGMGVVAGGLSDYAGLAGLTAAGFIAAASYLGPQVIEVGLEWLSKRAGISHPEVCVEKKGDGDGR
jgi:hypothetical protein